jgi:hypothetical protein
LGIFLSRVDGGPIKDFGTKAAHCVVDASRKTDFRLIMIMVMWLNELYSEVKQAIISHGERHQRYGDDDVLGTIRSIGTKLVPVNNFN